LHYVTGPKKFNSSEDHCENSSPNPIDGNFIFVAACGHKIKLTIEAIETAETDNLFIGNGVELCKNVLLDYSGGPDVNAITVLSQESFIWLKYRIKDPSGFRGFQGFVDVILVGSASFGCPENSAIYDDCGNRTCLSTDPFAPRHGYCFSNFSDDGDVSLVDGTPNSGVLQVSVHKKWFGVCADTWDQDETDVVCAELGFPRSSSHFNQFYNSTHINGSYLESISCYGFEDTLKECSSHVTKTPNCADDKIISIICGDNEEGSVKLVKRSDNSSGEVSFYYQGNWSYICRNELTDNAADVVCKQVANDSMGYVAYNFFGGTARKKGKQFAPLTFKCKGDEPSLNQCPYEKEECDKKDIVGVICKKSNLSTLTDSEVRLSGGEDEYSGYVEIWFNQEWCTVCDDAINIQKANIICKQLKFGDMVDFKPPENTTARNGTGPVMLSEINCKGNEQNILACNFPSIGKPIKTGLCTAIAYVTCSEPVVTGKVSLGQSYQLRQRWSPDGDVTDRTEEESQQETASIDKTVSANLQHGGDSNVKTIPSNEDTLSASAEDNCYEINQPALKDEDGEDPGVFDDQTSDEVPSLDEAQTNGSNEGVLLENRTYKDKDE
ncbi:putative deleted in malignant brain tumors 1 protein-like, partial [Apostichopus japonicus]